ncbi:hypothetical protein CA850_28655 [Micromonospora echinospora]|nr:hypothetical protein CA850_28655 [Micromonospora echinospora]
MIDGVQLLAGLTGRWATFARGNAIRFDRLRSPEQCRRALRGHGRAAIEQRLARLRGIQYEFRADGSLFISFVTPMVCRTPAGADTIGQVALRAVLESEPGSLRLADGRPMPAELAEHLRDRAGAACRTVGAAVGDLTVLDNHRMVRRSGFPGLVARQCDNMLGSFPPRAASPLDAAVKWLLGNESGAGHLRPVTV